MDQVNESQEQATDTTNDNTRSEAPVIEAPVVWPVKRTYAAENLGEAILYVMDNVGNIDKNSEIGTGSNAYKGIDDKDVKAAIRKLFIDAGLVILPIKITPTTKFERWTNSQNYDKQIVHTEIIAQYKLWHVPSNQFEILEGLGHGVDSQDKAAGKATTYALKYTLLYTFLVVTGKIDDADKTHSNDIPTAPPAGKLLPPPPAAPDARPTLTPSDTDNILKALKLLSDNKGDITKVRTFYKMSTKTEKALLAELPKYEASLKPVAPKEKPILMKDTPQYAKVLTALKNGVDGAAYTIDDVKKKYTVPIKNEREIAKEVEEFKIEAAVKAFDKLKKVPLPNDTALAIEEATSLDQLNHLQEECTDLHNTMPFMLMIFNKQTELQKLNPAQ